MWYVLLYSKPERKPPGPLYGTISPNLALQNRELKFRRGTREYLLHSQCVLGNRPVVPIEELNHITCSPTHSENLH